MKKVIVLISVMLMVGGYAHAADWNFYGSARIHTFVEDSDNAGNKNFTESLAGNSRIGARVQVSDELRGRFEYGAEGGNVNLRHLWGEWNFGPGRFLVGQTYSPLSGFGYSVMVHDRDSGLIGYGTVYSSREPMLQLRFDDFKIAAIRVKDRSGTATEVRFPCLEASYAINVGAARFKIGGGYQSYETAVGDVDSYIIVAGAKVKFGKASFMGSVHAGENGGDLIVGAGADTTGTKVLDTQNFGFILAANYKLNDMFTMEAGYGFRKDETDNSATDDERKAYYFQTRVNLAPGVFFVPEIGVKDDEDAGGDTLTYYGIKWQINF